MRSIRWIFLVAAVALVAPTELWAQGQGRGRGKGPGNRHEQSQAARDDDRRDDDDDRWEDRRGDDDDDDDDEDVVVLRDGNDRVVIVNPRDIERRYPVTQRQGRGPAFCRSGAGHPVWGPEWCLEKGWGLGSDRVVIRDRPVLFPFGHDVVVVRDNRDWVVVRDDRSLIERVFDRVLFWDD